MVMKSSNNHASTPALYICLFVVAMLSTSLQAAEVKILATPDDGVQPRLVTDIEGGVHLLYFKKRLQRPDAREGNLYYRSYDAQLGTFGLPVRVSSQAFNMQTYSIARAGMAIDGTGRLHVVWYRPREGQFYYSRSNPNRDAFEPQREVVSQYADGIDAGADVAALGDEVAIVWGAGDLSREYERTVFARLSSDNGTSFAPDVMIGNPDLGACACCSLAADMQRSGELSVAYRSAINGIGRHMQVLTVDYNADGLSTGSYAPVQPLQEWELSACPLSTYDFIAQEDKSDWLVFETESRIVELQLDSDEPPRAVADPYSTTRQKNPAIAINAEGERLIVWGEAISHSRGGRMNGVIVDSKGVSRPLLDSAIVQTVPDYSFPAAAPLPDGGFLVLY